MRGSPERTELFDCHSSRNNSLNVWAFIFWFAERRLVIEVLVHATQPSFRTSTGVPLKIVRLVPLFSMLRQSWALSWIGKNPQLADAFLSMPLQSYKPASKQMSADCMEHLVSYGSEQLWLTVGKLTLSGNLRSEFRFVTAARSVSLTELRIVPI